ncbi:MAG: aldose epimerase family protein [Segetibacter sp.]
MNQVYTGVVIDGKKVYWFDLKNSKGTEVLLTNYGAIISRYIVFNKVGNPQDIVLGFDTIKEYFSEEYLTNYPYFGAIVGRYANRIKDGKIRIKNKEFQLSRNAGNHCLHGGNTGFDKKVWDVAGCTSVTHDKVIFHYLSKKGEEGFSGNLDVYVSFELKDTNELVIDYTAACDSDTLVNLTHHDYFNLHPRKNNIAHHEAQIFASSYLEQDSEYIATGRVLPVHNTPYNFRINKKIGADWDAANGYNQSFILDKDPGQLSLAASFHECNSEISLEVYSTAPIAPVLYCKIFDTDTWKKRRTV